LANKTLFPGYLSTESPLYALRGNEAIFRRATWLQLCYPTAVREDMLENKGFPAMPAPYWQVVFLDLQARERVEGTDRLLLKGVLGLWVEKGQEGRAEFEAEVDAIETKRRELGKKRGEGK
jgi:hypothetical protein